MSEYRFPSEIRQLIRDALPADTSLFGGVPEVKYTYLPTGHARALNPDSMLVVGIRGAGKSFWWGALQGEGYRTLIGKNKTQAGIDKNTGVSLGFGEKPSNDYPGKDVLTSLLESFDARQIWRTVIIYQLTEGVNKPPFAGTKSWNARVEWVKRNPEKVEQLLFKIDNELETGKKYHLVLFDALDRTADDWKSMYAFMKGLLQVLLEFRSYKRIRPKAFVRPDHLEDKSVAAFPDSSKVLSQQTELTWPLNDLYGLLWQYLANVRDSNNIFRDGCRREFGIEWKKQDQVWTIPEPLRNDESKQREVFHAITGPYMGSERRRGFPYTWLPNHLGDARRLVSPRSILAALRHAAGDTSKQNYQFAIHYEGIKKGVQEASKIRVQEIQEDYPWVESLMKRLSGLSVPCPFEDIKRRWDQYKSLEGLQEKIQSEPVKLPPSHINSGADGVREDLQSLGLFDQLADGRVNLPDVYRIGYGIGRRGGVRAVYRER